MWSFPSWADPNLIANPDFETACDVITFYDASLGDPLLGTPTSSGTCRGRRSRS